LKTIRLSSSASQDLQAGHQFYELQNEGLGRHFLNCLTEDIDQLAITGGTHIQPFSNVHRSLSKRFPFAIYYTRTDNTLTVIAVLDCRQNPRSIINRFT
jgi:plasmid stabilization system protein ParE